MEIVITPALAELYYKMGAAGHLIRGLTLGMSAAENHYRVAAVGIGTFEPGVKRS